MVQRDPVRQAASSLVKTDYWQKNEGRRMSPFFCHHSSAIFPEGAMSRRGRCRGGQGFKFFNWLGHLVSRNVYSFGYRRVSLIRASEVVKRRFAAMVAVGLPGRDFASHFLGRRDATTKALAVERTQFDFRDVQPAAVLGCVMDFEALGQPPGFRWRKGFVERGNVLRWTKISSLENRGCRPP